MLLKDLINTYDAAFLQQKVDNKEWSEVADFFAELAEKRFTVAETGINRKLLHYWDEQGLLPFQKRTGWVKFSLIEVCWLRYLYELKLLGLGIERLQHAKTFFIGDKDFMMSAFNLSKANDYTGPEYDFGDGKKVILNEEIIDLLMENQYVKFSMLLLPIILKRSNIIVCHDSEGIISAKGVNPLVEKQEEQLTDFFKFFNGKSVTIVNLTNILTSVTATQDLFAIENNNIIVRQSAIALIKQLCTEDNITEIAIRLNNKKEALLIITKQLTYDQLHQRVKSLQRKGVFVDMTLKTRDGKMQLFEIKELSKVQ